MKSKMFVVLTVLLLLALVPALASAAKQAKPQQTATVRLNIRQPLGPQLDAQLGVGAKGPRSAALAPFQLAARGPSSHVIKPNRVVGLLNDGFEGGYDGGWEFAEFGLSAVGWDATDIESKRGQWSFYSAGWNNDEYVNPFYEDDMESWAVYPMDLEAARRVQIRFQYMSDTEFGFDGFFWCVSPDSISFTCELHTGSTNDTWRLVQRDSRNTSYLADALGSPDAAFGFLFLSDFIFVDRGTFVDEVRIRAWGP
jgi:hypothetical protein